MANYEQLSNQASTTLSAGMTAGQTTLSVTSATNFPTTGDFRVLVDSEIMLVTAVSGTTFTVTRGAESTSAATHSSGATIRSIVTAGAMEKFVNNYIPLAPDDLYQNHSITNASGNVLTASGFTWFNQGSATLTNLDMGGLRLTAPSHTGGASLRGGRLTSPGSTPYSVIAKLSMTFYGEDGINNRQPLCGIHFAENSTGKIVGIQWIDDSRLAVSRYTSPTSFSSNAVAALIRNDKPTELWLKLTDDGSNIKFFTSQTGTYWNQIHSETYTLTFTTGPDRVGFHINARYEHTQSPAVPAVPNWIVDVLHWSFE